MNTPQVIINGVMHRENTASLRIDDLSIVRGYGIFDFLKTVDNHPVFLEDNLDRFFHSADQMDLTVPFSRQEIREQIHMLMQANTIPNSGIKILLTGGYSPDGYTIIAPNLIITQSHLERNVASEKRGVRLVTFPYHRAFGTVKSIDYVMGIKALKKAKEAGADDVVYTQDDLISECPRANIFFVDKNGTLLTPNDDVLAGITRKHILTIAKNICPVEARDITLTDMQNAKEAFITSTTKNITPVTAIDNINYGPGAGPLTRKLQESLEELIFKNYGIFPPID
ncbi:MAG: aminotransferase class IV [Sphingobacterium sp.]|uniref:aminotransferase class IV n=1 Tax=Sphingobacterium sp. JB170 TaxID=1434842 RepID=UPI00097F0174|nr:aminotransferase class IV [Sphingobacterium sp. JB170]SJN38861.1 D-alanine aminotransferase [Sphingobacterium sp. JB170]